MNCNDKTQQLSSLTGTVRDMFRQAFVLLPWFCKNCPTENYTVKNYQSVLAPIKSLKRNKPMFFGELEFFDEANAALTDFYNSFNPEGNSSSNADAIDAYRLAWSSTWENKTHLQLRSTETKIMKYLYEILSGGNHVHMPELQGLARQIGSDVVAAARSVSVTGGWNPKDAFVDKTKKLNALIERIFPGGEVNFDSQHHVRTNDPVEFKSYQQFVKDRKHAAWLRFVEIFDGEIWHPTIDSATLHKRLVQEGLEEFLPATFRGRVGVGAEGYPLRFYTYAGLELDAIPLNDVEMNMEYADTEENSSGDHPCDDSTFYCQTTAMVGTAKTKYYTVDYRRRARRKKFASIEELANSIEEIRRRLNIHVNSTDRDTAVRALMCMLIDHTCARIGNMTSARAKKQTFGVTTLLTKKHAKILKDKIKISYTGKHEQPQMHTFRLFKKDADKRANPTEAIIAEKLKALIQEQNEYLFTNADGKPYTPQQVNEYFRADQPDLESNLPQGGANSPCTVHCFRNYHATRMFDEFAQEYIDFADQPPYKEVIAAYNGRKETKSAHAVEGILQKIANHLGNTPAICRKAYIAPASQLLFFTRFGYRPPDGLLKDVFHDEINDPYGLEKQKQFKFAKQRAKTARRRTKVTTVG